jgi:hypothetical protein
MIDIVISTKKLEHFKFSVHSPRPTIAFLLSEVFTPCNFEMRCNIKA